MTFRVQVRESKELEQLLSEGKDFTHLLNDEVQHNSNVIRHLLQYADRVIPKFKDLSEQEVKNIADAIAFSLRTDLVKREHNYFAAATLAEPIPKTYGEDGIQVHLKGDPEELNPKFKLTSEDERKNRIYGADEIFRSCCFAMQISKLYEKLDYGSSMAPCFLLGDMISYLLEPNDIIDYTYEEEEKRKYQEAVRKDMRSL